MANTFEFIGSLSIGKESEKFKPYEETSFPSGWDKVRLLFNVKSGSNRHLLTSEGMYKADGTGKVFTFTKGGVDPKTSERTKGEKLEVAWQERKKKDIIEQVAEFKKFVIDLEIAGRRYQLEKAIKEGITELNDDLDKLTESDFEDLEGALEKSKKKRFEYITEVDFTETLHKLFEKEAFKDKKFKVSGNIVYSEHNGKIYRKLVPTRIYQVPVTEEDVSIGNIVVFYNNESLDTGSFRDTKRMYVNGFVREYDGQRKANASFPIQLVIDGDSEDERVQKVVNLFKSQFTVSKKGLWKEFGVKVKMLNGSQEIELTDDMLSDFQKQMLELGEITKREILEELAREKGEKLYGDKVEEMIITNVSKGYTKGSKDTAFSNKDFENAPIVPKETVKPKVTADEEDLFDDIDDI